MDTKIEAKAVALFLYDSYEESYAAFKSFADINKHNNNASKDAPTYFQHQKELLE